MSSILLIPYLMTLVILLQFKIRSISIIWLRDSWPSFRYKVSLYLGFFETLFFLSFSLSLSLSLFLSLSLSLSLCLQKFNFPPSYCVSMNFFSLFFINFYLFVLEWKASLMKCSQTGIRILGKQIILIFPTTVINH